MTKNITEKEDGNKKRGEGKREEEEKPVYEEMKKRDREGLSGEKKSENK